MSFQAMTWAASRKWGGASARSVIYAITNHASDLWFCWARQQTLAEESEQSIDSVGRRIAEFVEAGEVRRIKLKRHGRRTSDFLILKPSPYFAAPLTEIEPYLPRGCDIMIEAETAHEPAAADDGITAAATCGSVDNEAVAPPLPQSEPRAAVGCGSVDPTVTLPQPAADAAALLREHEPDSNLKNSPQSPPSAEGLQSGLAKEACGQSEAGTEPPAPPAMPKQESPPQNDNASRHAIDKQLAAFRNAFPEPSNRPGEVAAQFRLLSDDQRKLAIRAAIGAGIVQRKNPRKALVDQLKFLRSPELLAEYARMAPALVEYATLTPATAEWRACVLMRDIAGLPAATVGTELRVQAPIPEAKHLEGLNRDRTRWVIAEIDTKQFVAWAGLVKKWTGRWPDGQRIYLDADGRPVPREKAEILSRIVVGKTLQGPRFTIGLLVPSEWPPRKDGTLSTGPPETARENLMTEADYREFVA